MATRKKHKIGGKILLLFAIIILLIFISVPFSNKPLSLSTIQNTLTLPELSTEGFVEVKPEAAISGNIGIIALTGGCYQITATTDLTQAQSIENGLLGKIDFRPSTHNIMKSIFDNLDIKVLMVKIVDLRNNTYFGKIILQQGNKLINLDSRPSDGIAIAVRTNSSIYIKETLLKQGSYIC